MHGGASVASQPNAGTLGKGRGNQLSAIRLFFVLAFGMLGFIAKSIIQWIMDI